MPSSISFKKIGRGGKPPISILPKWLVLPVALDHVNAWFPIIASLPIRAERGPLGHFPT
jgi:hypothetical protein